MTKQNKRRLGAAVLLGAAALALGAWLTWRAGVFLPRAAARTAACPLRGDGSVQTVALAGGAVTVSDGGTQVFCTDRACRAEDFCTGDIDGDGAQELLVLIWRRGSFGSARPFWVKKNDTGWSQHIFIYRWKDGAPQPVWMSSALRPRVKTWALQADGTLDIQTPAGEDTRWAWRSWGLERIDKPPAAF